MKDAISSEPGKPVLPAIPKSLSAWAASPAGQRLHHLPRTRQRSGRLCTRTLAGPRVRTAMCTCSTGVHARPLRTPQAGAGSRRLHCPCSSGGQRKVHRWPTELVGSLRGTVPIEKGKDPRTHPFSWASDWAVSPEEELALA